MNNFMSINLATQISGQQLGIDKLPNLTQEQVDKASSPLSIIFLNTFPQRKLQAPDGFTREFHKILREEIISILHKLFQKTEEEGILQNSFTEASIILVAKNRQSLPKKGKLQTNSIHVHRCKHSNQIFNKLNLTTHLFICI